MFSFAPLFQKTTCCYGTKVLVRLKNFVCRLTSSNTLHPSKPFDSTNAKCEQRKGNYGLFLQVKSAFSYYKNAISVEEDF
jgi:hypothetical protein